jgi:hypothetical protein
MCSAANFSLCRLMYNSFCLLLNTVGRFNGSQARLFGKILGSCYVAAALYFVVFDENTEIIFGKS